MWSSRKTPCARKFRAVEEAPGAARVAYTPARDGALRTTEATRECSFAHVAYPTGQAVASSVTARADCTAARIRSVEDSPRVSQASMLLVTPLSPPPLCVRVFWLIFGV